MSACMGGRVDECDVNVPVSISELDWFRSGEEKEKGRNFASAESGHFRGMRVCVCLSAIGEACEVRCSDSCHMHVKPVCSPPLLS